MLPMRFLFPHQLLHTLEFQMGSFNQGHHVPSPAADHRVSHTREEAVVPVATRYNHSAHSGKFVVAGSPQQCDGIVLRFKSIVSVSAHQSDVTAVGHQPIISVSATEDREADVIAR